MPIWSYILTYAKPIGTNDMEVILMTVLPGLGAFAPFAVLAWWIVCNQAKQLEAKDAHCREITDRVVEALTRANTAVHARAEQRAD